MQAAVIEELLFNNVTCLGNWYIGKQTYHIKTDQDIRWIKVEIFNFFDER
jgi:hypothetical protein